jgi:hypothetical protein
MQNSLSFSTDAKQASVFGAVSPRGAVLQAELKPNAKVVTVKGIDYAEDLNPRVDELKKKGIDAVYLEGEKEVVVLDKSAVKTTGKYKEFKAIDAKNTDFTDLYNQATSPKTEGVAPTLSKTVDDTAKVTFGELHDSGYLTDDVASKLGKQYGLNAEQVKAIGKEHSVLSPTRQKMIKADEAQKAAQSTEKPKVTMQEGRANRVLDKKIRYNGKVMTRGEYIDALISDGYTPTQKTVNGKTTYSMKSPKGDYYDISKIEYAKAAPTPPKGVAPKSAPVSYAQPNIRAKDIEVGDNLEIRDYGTKAHQ